MKKFRLKKMVIIVIIILLLIRLLSIIASIKCADDISLDMSITLYTDNKVCLNLKYVAIKTHSFRIIRGVYNILLHLKITENYSSIKLLTSFRIRGLKFLPTMFHIKGIYSENKGNITFEFLGPLTSKAQVFIHKVGRCYNILITGDRFMLYFIPSEYSLRHVLESLGYTIEEFKEEFKGREFKIFIRIKTRKVDEFLIEYCRVNIIRGRIILEGDIECKVSYRKNLWDKAKDILALYLKKMNFIKMYKAFIILSSNVTLRYCNVSMLYTRILKTNYTMDIIDMKGISLKSIYREGKEGTIHVLKTISNIYQSFEKFKISNATIVIIEGENEVSITSNNLPVKPCKIKYLPDGRKMFIFNSPEILLRLNKVMNYDTAYSFQICYVLLSIIVSSLVIVIVILFKKYYYYKMKAAKYGKTIFSR